MNIHKNARLTPRGQSGLYGKSRAGRRLEAVAEAVGVCPRTARKWVDRYRREGLAGLQTSCESRMASRQQARYNVIDAKG